MDAGGTVSKDGVEATVCVVPGDFVKLIDTWVPTRSVVGDGFRTGNEQADKSRARIKQLPINLRIGNPLTI
jgi:hypothetical protein